MPSLDPTTHCPVCDLKYTFVACRITSFDKEGNKVDECLKCSITRDKEELSTGINRDTDKSVSYTN